MKNSKLIFIASTILVCFVLAGVFYFHKSQAQTSATTISGKFYKLDILATSTSSESLLPGASINDKGVVSFSGGGGLHTANGVNPVRTINRNQFFLTHKSIITIYSFRADSVSDPRIFIHLI